MGVRKTATISYYLIVRFKEPETKTLETFEYIHRSGMRGRIKGEREK
jgi:hypothetical protein